MQRYYDELLNETRGQYQIIVDKTWEDLHPKDCFDDAVTDIQEICEKIDRGSLDWFMLRVRVLYAGVEMSSEYIGGFLYEDAREVLKDGVAEDIIEQALYSAKAQAVEWKKRFADLVI
jgi:hypothetical protein